MFSKKILLDDLKSYTYVNSQIDNCKKLLTKSIVELVEDQDLNELEIADEKETILTLTDELKALRHQLASIEEHMYLNYINKFRVKPITPPTPPIPFPHINTIDS